MNHIGNLYPQPSQHHHYAHESPVLNSSNKSKQVFSPHILQHQQNHSQLIHPKQQTMKLPITPCTGTNNVPSYLTQQQQQHFPKSSSSKNNHLNTTWKNEPSEIATSKSTTTTTNNNSPFIQAHQLLPSGLNNNNNNNNFHHIILENNKNQLHNHHHHLSQKKVPIPIPKMEELSVFQQQQQPLDFRTTNFAAAAYEMSARLNNPLLGAVKSSNSISQSHLFLQALQTNPALLNEYIRVSGINSAASSVVGSTSTTIPNESELTINQQQQQQQQRMLNNRATTVNNTTNRIMSTSNGNGSLVNNSSNIDGLHLLTAAAATATTAATPAANLSHDLIEGNLQSYINQEFLRIIFRNPEFLTMFADPNLNKIIQFMAQNQLQQQQIQQQQQQQLLFNSLTNQTNLNNNYFYMDSRNLILSKNMKGVKSSVNTSAAKFANLYALSTPSSCDYDPNDEKDTSSSVSSMSGPNMSSSSSSSVESYDSKSSCGGSSAIMAKHFIPYKKRAFAMAPGGAGGCGDDHSSASSVSSDAASPPSNLAVNESLTVSSQPVAVVKKPPNDQPQHKKIKRCPHVWQFCCDLLDNDKYNPHIIKWLNKDKGIFKIVKPDKVAELWGMQKNRKSDKKMNYEKMARGMRYSRREGFFKKLDKEKNKPNEYGKQLVFQFSEKVVNNMECKWKFAI